MENDWKCPTCGNVNWGTQKSCTICGTKMNGEEGLPKESAATPSRESDDDDMYDAFGRKKKRYRHGKTEDSQVDMSIIRQSLKATEESTKKGTEQSTDVRRSRSREHAHRSSRSRSRSHSHSRSHYHSRSRHYRYSSVSFKQVNTVSSEYSQPRLRALPDTFQTIKRTSSHLP